MDAHTARGLPCAGRCQPQRTTVISLLYHTIRLCLLFPSILLAWLSLESTVVPGGSILPVAIAIVRWSQDETAASTDNSTTVQYIILMDIQLQCVE